MPYAILSQTVQTWREFGKGINMEKRNKESGGFAFCQNAQIVPVSKVWGQGQ